MLYSIYMVFKKNIIYVCVVTLIVGLVILAGVLRFYDLSHQSYWMDEGYTVNAVTSVLERGSTVLDSGQRYPCSTYCYPTAYIVNIFGDSPAAYRFISALLGFLFIFVVFFITQDMFNSRIALLSSFFTAFSYWQIAWSRQARWYTLFATFFWLSLYFFYKTLYSQNKKYTYLYGLLTCICLIIAVMTHTLGYILPIVYMIWIAIEYICIQKKYTWKKIVTYCIWCGLCLAVLSMITNVNIIEYVISIYNPSYVLPYYANFYLHHYWLYIVCVVALLLSGNIPYKKTVQYVLLPLGIYGAILSFFTSTVHYRYLFHVTPVFFIIASVGILYMYDKIKKISLKVLFCVCIFGLSVTMGGITFSLKNEYYLESDSLHATEKRPYYVYTPQPDWNAAYAFIRTHQKSDDIVISSHPHFNKIFLHNPGYWLAYDYLGLDNATSYVQNNKEYYVGALVVSDVYELEEVTKHNTGYIIFDFMSADKKIHPEILTYIQKNFTLVFNEKVNSFSKIWIYRF